MPKVPIPDGGHTDAKVVVIIDALAARYGGTAYAAIQLAAALRQRDDVGRVIVVAQRKSIVGRSITDAEPGNSVLLDAPARGELAWRIGWETARLPALVARTSADALLSFSGMVPRRPGVPVISVLANPVPFVDRRSLGAWLRRAAIRRTQRFASASYVPSNGMLGLVGGDTTKVVPLGVDRSLFTPQERPGDELLYVADFYAHKRHDLLLAAWHLLPEPRPRLRLIGNPDVDRATYDAVRHAATDPRIIVEGRVSLPELVAAYRGARAMVVPSERESFCMPVVEAVASGVPAVIADHAVLRETAGGGGLVVPEATASAWSHALGRVVADEGLHAKLRAAGLAHGERFSWAAMAATVAQDARAAR